eukprot:scaffold487_cov344-Prasinococcus_capsulatus_cf.AAC.5
MASFSRILANTSREERYLGRPSLLVPLLANNASLPWSSSHLQPRGGALAEPRRASCRMTCSKARRAKRVPACF